MLAFFFTYIYLFLYFNTTGNYSVRKSTYSNIKMYTLIKSAFLLDVSNSSMIIITLLYIFYYLFW